MKKLLFVLIAAACAVSISLAFTPGKSASKKDTQRWQFNGTTVAEESDPSNYSLITGSDPSCSGEGLDCIIEAPADPLNSSQPDLSQKTVIATKGL